MAVTVPPMDLEIEELPDDCLMLIFERCSLHQLIRMRKVSRRWWILVGVLCAGKQSLKLFGSFRGLVNFGNRIKSHRLMVPRDNDFLPVPLGGDVLIIPRARFTIATATSLAELFPNIKSLVFYFFAWPTEPVFEKLIGEWQELMSLTLHRMPALEETQRAIWDSVGSISTLRRLHLLGMKNITLPEEMPIMAQLEHFSLIEFGQNNIVPLLAQLGPECTFILLDNVNCSIEQLTELVNTNQHLARNLSHFLVRNLFLPRQTARAVPFVPPIMPELFDMEFDQFNDHIAHVMQLNAAAIQQPVQPAPVQMAPQMPVRGRPDKIPNAEDFLKFISTNLPSLQYMDLTSMQSNSNLSIPFYKLLNGVAALQELRSLRLLIYPGDLDFDDNLLIPFDLIRTLHIELYPHAVERFLRRLPRVFPNVEVLNIVCYDKNNLEPLKTRLRQICGRPHADREELERLGECNLTYQRDLSYYFRDFGYEPQYRAYMQENMGTLVNLLE